MDTRPEKAVRLIGAATTERVTRRDPSRATNEREKEALSVKSGGELEAFPATVEEGEEVGQKYSGRERCLRRPSHET